MSNIIQSTSEEIRFKFEEKYCYLNPHVFVDEAINLKYCADILVSFEAKKLLHQFDVQAGLEIFPKELLTIPSFNYRTIRMLWAYSLENLIKYHIIKRHRIDHPDFHEFDYNKIKGHHLKLLLSKISIDFAWVPEVFINTWTKCSIWAGRYPLALKSEDMYRSRRSSGEASDNTHSTIKIQFGKADRLVESDLMHTNIGDYEADIYKRLYQQLIDLI